MGQPTDRWRPRSQGCYAGRMEPLLLALIAALSAAVLVLAGLLLVQRRTRRQLDQLMQRIDGLEKRIPSADSEPAAAAPDDANDEAERVSRDVLAGRTSFVRRAVGGELTRPVSLAGQAIALVHARIRDNVAPAELASELAISLRTLERGLAAELGCSPRQLILAMKMREAGRLLGSGRYRVSEVANELGFATPSHFSRCFRSFYRVPPSEVARETRLRPFELND